MVLNSRSARERSLAGHAVDARGRLLWTIKIGFRSATTRVPVNGVMDNFAGHLNAQVHPHWVVSLESTVRYLGIEVDDALQCAEQTDV
jgi:hypothetical protein